MNLKIRTGADGIRHVLFTDPESGISVSIDLPEEAAAEVAAALTAEPPIVVPKIHPGGAVEL